MELINDHNIGRKYGKNMTINETKYDLDEFRRMLMDNEEFYNDIKQQILNKINEIEPVIEEVVLAAEIIIEEPFKTEENVEN